MTIFPEGMCVYHMCAWYHRSQRRVSDHLKLELGVIVSLYMGTGKQPQVLCKTASAFHHLAVYQASTF